MGIYTSLYLLIIRIIFARLKGTSMRANEQTQVAGRKLQTTQWVLVHIFPWRKQCVILVTGMVWEANFALILMRQFTSSSQCITVYMFEKTNLYLPFSTWSQLVICFTEKRTPNFFSLSNCGSTLSDLSVLGYAPVTIPYSVAGDPVHSIFNTLGPWLLLFTLNMLNMIML